MKTLAILLAALTFTATAACNTVAGVGEDVESVGETVQDAAE
ncbi:MAG: entericidin A/B family lipoprotein [Pseudomonadota bacterium]